MSKDNEGRIRWGEIYLCDLGTSENSVQAGIDLYLCYRTMWVIFLVLQRLLHQLLRQ